MPRLRHYDNHNSGRFVTFCCYRRQNLLTSDFRRQAFVEALDAIRSKYNLKIFGYVIMPNHVHLVIHPLDNTPLGRIIGEIKVKSAVTIISKEANKLPPSCRTRKAGRERWAFWQARCYDHNCRTTEALLTRINYCHKNPVGAHLVDDPGEWRWSSYNWYDGAENVPLAMDGLKELVRIG